MTNENLRRGYIGQVSETREKLLGLSLNESDEERRSVILDAIDRMDEFQRWFKLFKESVDSRRDKNIAEIRPDQLHAYMTGYANGWSEAEDKSREQISKLIDRVEYCDNICAHDMVAQDKRIAELERRIVELELGN